MWMSLAVWGCNEQGFNPQTDGVETAQDTEEAGDTQLLGEECVDGQGRPEDAEVRWTWSDGNVYSTPVIGDLDGDGSPEVVTHYNDEVDHLSGHLVVLDADGQGVWSREDVGQGSSGVALGDLNGDGSLEVVSAGAGGLLRAYSAQGETLWTANVPAYMEYPTVVDLDGDGASEVVVSTGIFEGATGELLTPIYREVNGWGPIPVPADLEGDGVMELLVGNEIFEIDGGRRYQCGPSQTEWDIGNGTTSVPWDVDGDGILEVLASGSGTATLCDADGEELWRWVYSEEPNSYGAVACIADFDGDGQTEAAMPLGMELRLVEGDGSVRWTVSGADSSGRAGCAAWDMNADGAAELLFGSETAFWVRDGATGGIVWADETHRSITMSETPVVADLDGDGLGEVVYASNGADKGLTVLTGDWSCSSAEYRSINAGGEKVFRGQE